MYTAQSGINKPIRLVMNVFQSFHEGRFLAYQMFIRDLKASVRQSFLGFLWHFIPALATAAIWIVLNNQKIVTLDNVPMNYPAFAITGTVIWALFTESVNKPLTRFTASKSILVKLNFPREALVLASIYDMLFSMVLKLLVLIPALIAMGYTPELNWLVAILSLLPLVLLGLSIGVLLVPIGMLYTDIGKGLSFVFQLLMYLSPVVYPLSTEGVIGLIHKLNPSTPFIESARSSFGDYSYNLYEPYIIWSGISVLLFVGSLIILRVSLSAIIERSGS